MEIEPEIIQAARNFKGHGRQLEAALGTYVLARLYGWRVLHMLHGRAYISAKEEILGISFRDYCEERTSLSRKCLGIQLADSAGAFWRIAIGSEEASRRGILLGGGTEQGELW